MVMKRLNKNNIRHFDIVYFIAISLFWLVIDLFLSAIKAGRIALLVIIIYSWWYVLGASILFRIRKRKGVRDDFEIHHCMEKDGSIVWLDLVHKELAYLFVLYPLRIQYVSFSAIEDAYVEVDYSKDPAYINRINCVLVINHKKRRIGVATSGRYARIETATDGKEYIRMAEEFVERIKANGS